MMFGCTEKEREATESEYEKIAEIFVILCDSLKLEEEITVPSIKIASPEKIIEISGINASDALYDTETKTIYIADMDSEYSVALIAHELTHYINHYMSGFPETYGFDYWLTEDFKVGFFLTEGITQYLSSKVYPMPDTHTAYPFETMIAEQLEAIIGEDELRELFLTSDVEKLKNKFNNLAYRSGVEDQTVWNGLIMTPFDFLCSFLDMYSDAFYARDMLYQQYAHTTLSVLWSTVKNTNRISNFESILNNFIDHYLGTFGFLKT